MDIDIPEFVLEFVKLEEPITKNKSVWTILTSLRNASDLTDPYLRAIIIETLE